MTLTLDFTRLRSHRRSLAACNALLSGPWLLDRLSVRAGQLRGQAESGEEIQEYEGGDLLHAAALNREDLERSDLDDEMMAEIGAAIGAADALLIGRETYEEWAAFWPNQSGDEDPIAAFMNNPPKYVASTTLDEVDWNNSTLIEGDVPAAVAKLKEQPGKDIAINGSSTLVRSLLKEGLIDELKLMIHPIVVGEGRRLFENGLHSELELADAKVFGTGVVYATYRPAVN
jgi:dihydrofolate reductase